MNDPLDPRLASLLRFERARPDPTTRRRRRGCSRRSSRRSQARRSRRPRRGSQHWMPTDGDPSQKQLSSPWRSSWEGPLSSRRAERAPDRVRSAARAPTSRQACGSRLSRRRSPPSPVPNDVLAAPAAQPRAGPLPGASSGAIGLGAERVLLDRARRSLLHGDPLGALAAVGEHERRFPRGVLSEERDALRVEALVAAARFDDARASAAAFHAAHPGSLLTPAVDSALTAIP